MVLAADAGADLGAAGFLAVAAPTPFLIVPMTVLFAGAPAAVFLTTVPVLPSLESLTRLPVRVPGRDGALAAVVVLARRVRVGGAVPVAGAGADAFELAVDAFKGREGAVRLVFFAFSTILDRADRALLCCLTGDDVGRAIWEDFDGEEGGRSRASDRVLDEVGDRTCDELNGAGAARCFFLGLRICSFSLSPPAIVSLQYYVSKAKCYDFICKQTSIAWQGGLAVPACAGPPVVESPSREQVAGAKRPQDVSVARRL